MLIQRETVSEHGLEQFGHFGRIARDRETAGFHDRQLGVSRVSAPNSFGLVNTRGKDKGEITPNEEEVYHIEGMPAEWDASRFEVIEEEETYDAFGVNTKNSFNTPPKSK
jgi:hypothetical protein